MFLNVDVVSHKKRSPKSLLFFLKVPFGFLFVQKASLLNTSIVSCQCE